MQNYKYIIKPFIKQEVKEITKDFQVHLLTCECFNQNLHASASVPATDLGQDRSGGECSAEDFSRN